MSELAGTDAEIMEMPSPTNNYSSCCVQPPDIPPIFYNYYGVQDVILRNTAGAKLGKEGLVILCLPGTSKQCLIYSMTSLQWKKPGSKEGAQDRE